uniref:Reverse transcriptase zinc-binding domain-containing protein n=1 Tax=Nelumbo nucifera TaxID=4432 RepID=A0A822Y7M6_NELNU|nr:TPA_asm: hypothetical protein HUJ06_029730 [Nelumbo nucifera]
MLTSLFSASEVAGILTIPLSMEEEEDKLIWAYSKDGQYSVKSSYQIARKLNEETRRAANNQIVTQAPPSLWKKVWQLKVPPKIKNFIWRVCW